MARRGGKTDHEVFQIAKCMGLTSELSSIYDKQTLLIHGP
jgi:hypothetical protein